MDCAADDACVGHLGCGNRLPSRDTTDTLMHIMTRANLRLWLMHGTAFSRVPQVGKALYWDSRKPNSHAPCETKMPKPLLTHYDPITEKHHYVPINLYKCGLLYRCNVCHEFVVVSGDGDEAFFLKRHGEPRHKMITMEAIHTVSLGKDFFKLYAHGGWLPPEAEGVVMTLSTVSTNLHGPWKTLTQRKPGSALKIAMLDGQVGEVQVDSYDSVRYGNSDAGYGMNLVHAYTSIPCRGQLSGHLGLCRSSLDKVIPQALHRYFRARDEDRAAAVEARRQPEAKPTLINLAPDQPVAASPPAGPNFEQRLPHSSTAQPGRGQ